MEPIKNALITGAASGGRYELAKLLQKMEPVITARDENELENTSLELKKHSKLT